MYFAVRWNQVFHSLSLGWFGYMSSTALVNTQHASSTLSNRVPFSRFFISGNRKRSQGERSGEYGGCGSSCTLLSLRKSTVVAAVCTPWHCHDEERSHRVPSLDGTGTKRRRPSGDNDARIVCLCPQGEWWQHGLIFWRNGQPFSSVRCVILVFDVGICPETARPLTASWFPDHIDRFKFCHQSALPRSILNRFRWTFTTWTCTTQP